MRTPTRQEQTAKQDAQPYATKSKCSTHLVEYYTPAGKSPHCPMCALERKHDDVRAELLARTNELKVVSSQLSRLQTQVDLHSAIRAAIPVLDDNDLGWLKVHMYQYKIDKSVMLKPTHGKVAGGNNRLRRGDKLPVNGFMTVPKRGDPEAHAATSLGGLAMAEYLDEAITVFGSAQAMGIMLKAWWKALPGAQT